MRARILKARIVVLLVILTAIAPRALAGITGSKHDFSSQGWSGGEICVVCHTPHNADPYNQNPTDAPLWNHELTTATYTLYSSPTLDVTPDQPGGVSKLCLSCHDGTVALDSFGGTTGSNFITGGALVGTDLSNDHPVSIYWDHQTGQGTCSNCHIVHPWGSNDILPFFDGKVECATCHDPHDFGSGSLLRMDNTGSALCLHCHGK